MNPWPIWRLREKAEAAGTERARAILHNAERFPSTRETAEELLNIEMIKVGLEPDEEILFARPADPPVSGEELADVIVGKRPMEPYSFILELLVEHMLVAGTTGSGKSTLMGALAAALIRRGVSVIVFDTADEYGWLLNEFPYDPPLVVSARDFPMAFFENPIGSSLSDLAFLGRRIGVLRETMWINEGGANILLREVGRMFRDRGVFDGARDFPTLAEVFDHLRGLNYRGRPREAGYLDGLINRFYGLCQSFPGFNARRSVSPAQLLHHSVIIRMADLNLGEIDVFGTSFISWLLALLEACISDVLQAVLFADEFGTFTNDDKEKASSDQGESQMLRALRTSRKLGLGIVAGDQVPSLLSPTAIGNFSNKVVMRLISRNCVYSMASSLGLSPEQMEVLPQLARRQAVVQTPLQPEPVLIQIREIPRKRLPTVEELEARERETLELLDHEPGDRDVHEVLFGPADQQEEEEDQEQVRGISIKVLSQIAECPFELIEERCESLGTDRSEELRARKDLEVQALIEGVKVGARWQIYGLTAKGRRLAEELGLTVHRFKSGLAHEFMVVRTERAVHACSSRISFVSSGEELGSSGIQPDLVATIRNENGEVEHLAAFQICWKNKPDYEVQSVRRLLEVPELDAIVVVARNKGTAGRLTDALEEAGIEVGGGERAGGQRAFGHEAQRAEVRVLAFQTAIHEDTDWTWLLQL